MNDKFNTKYSPKLIESKWYKSWLKNDLFKWNNSSKKNTFSIQLPPPNVTGSLHMGHAYQQTLMDILIRFNKMIGNDINWIVGTDHAGIATQIVVERQLALKGINPKELTREEFIKKIWDWKTESGNTILNQMQRIGVAANWNFADENNKNQGYFTMDSSLSKSVAPAWTLSFLSFPDLGTNTELLFFSPYFRVVDLPNFDRSVSECLLNLASLSIIS